MKNHFALIGLVLSFLISVQAQAAAPLRDWNFLVFLNGVNNLDYFSDLNINQMETVGSNERLNILVQWGTLRKTEVDRLLVQKDSDGMKVTSPVVNTLAGADMGDWKQLVEFARWAQENYPAKRTMIVVWNHGGGWHRSELLGAKDISWDDRTGNVITTEQLGQAMREISSNLGRKVDIYSSDACLMGMVEVGDEMADAVDIYVGSQDLEPGEGWPYSTFLQAWAQDMNRTPAEVGVLLSKKFLEAYSGGIYGRSSVTMSVYDLNKIGMYRRAVAAVTSELATLPAETLTAVKQAADGSKFFFNRDYRDVIDFLNQLDARQLTPPSAPALRLAQEEFVLSNDQNQDRRTFGVSIWLPTQTYELNAFWNRYQKLSFHRNTGWGLFLKKMLP